MTTPLVFSTSVIDPLEARRQRRQTYHMARRIVGSLAKDLRAIDERLGTLAAAIPQPGPDFDLLEEFGVGVRCVRGDLLGDAIETLEVLAHVDDDGLCRRYEERQRLLAKHG